MKPRQIAWILILNGVIESAFGSRCLKFKFSCLCKI